MKDALLNEVAQEAVLVLKGKKCERRKNELKKICETALSLFSVQNHIEFVWKFFHHEIVVRKIFFYATDLGIF